jgi:predicted MFS family arabinose efflux permease
VGSLLIPPLVQYLIPIIGWRHTYLVLAAFPLLVGAPLTFLFARAPSATDLAKANPTQSGDTSGIAWPQALASTSFWLLALGVCALSLSENGALAHLAPMLSEHGLTPRDVAFTASLLGVSSVVGRFILGWLLDYLQGSYIAVASLLAAGAGMLLLSHASTFSAAAPAAFIAGLGAGCELDLIPYMLRRYFGLRSFSTLYGLVYTFFAVAGAVAPLIVGHIYDATGSYTGILNIFCAATLIGALAMFALPAYRYVAQATVPEELAKEAGSDSLLTHVKGVPLENN